ncbi:MAG: DUF445 family protein [Candidatus Sericytochromatia bacterium]
MPAVNEVLQLVLPPLLGAAIGYGTNDLAIRMLFRPYKAYYLFGRRVPFTPGMVPKEQGRIAEKVGTTITTHLLTKDEIGRLSRRLVSEENIDAMVDRLLSRVSAELEKPERQQQVAERLADVAAGFLAERLPQLLHALADSDELDQTSRLISARLVERLHDFRVTPTMADFLAEKVMQTLLTPSLLRKALIWVLTKENSEALAAKFKERAGAFAWVVDIIEPATLLQRLRETMETEPERTEQALGSLLGSLGIQARIAAWLVALRLEDLPEETTEAVRTRIVQAVREGIGENEEAILKAIADHVDMKALLTRLLVALFARGLPPQAKATISAHLGGMLHQYLDAEVEGLAERALETIDIRGIIVKNVNAFPPERVERIIYELSRRELKGIIYLGGLLGFLVGCFQVGLSMVLR